MPGSRTKPRPSSKRRILELIQNVSVWKRGGKRAPHKPLLILLALTRVSRGEPRLAQFREVDGPLKILLQEFGPPGGKARAEYPFCHLQNDGLWEIPGYAQLPKRRESARRLHFDVTRGVLLKHNAEGGFPESIWQALKRDPGLVEQAAVALLEAHFPTSLHEDILEQVGLPIPHRPAPRRDPRFREDVIRAYEHRCAMCGYGVKLGNHDLALEAAHIKWRQALGPNEVSNGLALCAIHHKALDCGAISLTDDLTVLVSADVHGHAFAEEWFLGLVGREARRPYGDDLLPRRTYLSWHRQQVFRSPARG